MKDTTAFIVSSVDSSIDGCTIFEVNFDVELYSDQLYQSLGICSPNRMKRAVVKRKAEYLAGRFATKECFRKLCVPVSLGNFNLESGNRGVPLWPDNLIGSITHSGNRACAIVAKSDVFEAIGVDIEHWIDVVRFEQIKSQFLSFNEIQLLRKQAMPLREQGTIVFSAKESLFKALYPSIGVYFDFNDAEVIGMDIQSSSLQIRLLRTLSDHSLAQEGRVFIIEFRADSFYASTRLCLKYAL